MRTQETPLRKRLHKEVLDKANGGVALQNTRKTMDTKHSGQTRPGFLLEMEILARILLRVVTVLDPADLAAIPRGKLARSSEWKRDTDHPARALPTPRCVTNFCFRSKFGNENVV